MFVVQIDLTLQISFQLAALFQLELQIDAWERAI